MGDPSGSRSGAPSRLHTKAMEAFSLPARRASLARFETSPADSFFASEPPPPNVATAGLRVRQFVRPLHEEEALKEAKVAIVTAGGTDVPLEREAVRYITNTSSGARGAALCEQLLRLGYYVILVTSIRAIKPFVRHLLPTYPMPAILDFISLRVQQQQQQGEAGEAGEQEQQQQREEEPQQQQQQKLPLQPIVEEPSESVGSEDEVEAPAAASTSRGLAYQVYEVVEQEVSEGVSVTSVGSVLSSSDSAAAAEDAAAAAAAAAEGSAAAARAKQRPPTDPAEPAGAAASGSAAAAAAAAAGPWQVSLKGPLQRGGPQGPQELPEEEVEAAGWEFEGGEAEAALRLYRHCKDRLLCVTYKTLAEYAFIVRAVAAGAAPLRERLMFCSAAAVADFYLPYSVRSPHKLKTPQHHETAHRAANAPGAAAAAAATADGGSEVQRGPSRSISTMTSMQPKRWFTGEVAPQDSYKGAGDAGEAAAAAEASDAQQQHHSHHFSLRLWVAPKMLLVVRSVAPHCFLVAFKLETDESRLQQSAMSYLEGSSSSNNGSGVADCVVGNALRTRREKATLFTKIGQKEVKQKNKQTKKYLGHGTIEARLAKYLFKLQSLKIKEAFL
ncbi:DNA/pantothenate metabolism flavoprotein domain-containing protein, putative [Eimeria tenella]|uniref:DNA/pantothenate metabolism flavoprotein domain-containing protein, putative n=1 Tax=Eimeria tenella TaxID=5802 RepID=U6KMK5_EIMTE|nr:DNA/pantothenate metabolism flavoprotein domain-containing protein, putative [Eimeria tenella]CDJ39337.1 DNA/pantothenate metabolism flavoprotein domain-containing protein, putative [Eimeria tenella]|eukprot:XP_013230092.1 DNA/pantothenate metabolism flavoprotein domain-containing protein, putative [Eimeria tenella]